MDTPPALAYSPASLRKEALENMARNGRRLIEDYLPIREISAEASREKSVRRGHISTLHLWWARRPLVACRAAIYAALVPADFYKDKATILPPLEDPGVNADAQEDLGRISGRGRAGEFIKDLCKYPGDLHTIEKARQHILEMHAAKLSAETGKAVSVEDILKGDAPRPRVLDMFAGGGSIPLEALRLGCEAYALDLNPVAHIIELCTLVYPQKYGQPDTSVKGSAKDGTWAGLAEEVRSWGNWVLERAKAEVGDLYPQIPDPDAPPQPLVGEKYLPGMDPGDILTVPGGYLTPVAYLWTRTVRCKNSGCGATVPLVRQTWLCKKKNRYVALSMLAPKGRKQAQFNVIEAESQSGLGFDPAEHSKGGNATCPWCGTVADAAYVKSEGLEKRIGSQMMGMACVASGRKGKVYLSADQAADLLARQGRQVGLSEEEWSERISAFCERTGLSLPNEEIHTDAKNLCWVRLYGFSRFCDLFNHRQAMSLLAFTHAIHEAEKALREAGYETGRAVALLTALGCVLDKQVDFNSSLCRLEPDGGRGIHNTFCRPGLPMVWDYAEANPFNLTIACWTSALKEVIWNLRDLARGNAANVLRGSATKTPWSDATFDAIVTDPPYYDNVPYSNLSDFFYVWLKRAIGHTAAAANFR